MIRHVSRLAVLLLAGCAAPHDAPRPDNADAASLLAGCCSSVEIYPKALVQLVDPKADHKPVFSSTLRLRSPKLKERPEVWDHVSRYLRPFDIVLTSDKGQFVGQFVVGYMTHTLVYLGTEAQLRRAGLWDHPDLLPHRDRVRAGQVFFEAMPPMVDFTNAANVMDVDAVAIWRPALTDDQRRDVLTRLMLEHGKPFDRHMDSRTQDCRYCAELLAVAFPMLNLIQREVYGRPVVIPDEIAASAIRGQVPLTFVGYVHGANGQVVSAPVEDLAVAIGRYWP